MALTFTKPAGPSVIIGGGGTDANIPNVAAYGTTAEWVASGHVLGVAEIGWDTTTGALAIGDNVHVFTSLPSIGSSSGATVLLIDTVEDLPAGTPAGVVVVLK